VQDEAEPTVAGRSASATYDLHAKVFDWWVIALTA